MRKIPFRFTRNKEKAGAEQQAATSGAASNTATRKEPEPVVGAACESFWGLSKMTALVSY